jgi:transposase
VNWNFSKPTSKELLGDWQGALMVDEFAGSEAAGQRAAAIQSLLETARLNGIELMAWLTDTLEKLPSWPNSRIDELLPLKNPA